MQGAIEQSYGHIEAPTYSVEGVRPRILRTDCGNPECWTSPAFYYLKEANWIFRRKLVGMQLRIYWDGDKVIWNGKTNACQDFPERVQAYLREHLQEELFEEIFGRKEVLLFGELMGPKIQKNELELLDCQLFLFDVQVGKVFLKRKDVQDIARRFLLACPDDIFVTYGSLEWAIRECSKGKFSDWEGLVGTPEEELLDKQGKRIICKIKTRDYYAR